jgi:virginiamycin B lyase
MRRHPVIRLVLKEHAAHTTNLTDMALIHRSPPRPGWRERRTRCVIVFIAAIALSAVLAPAVDAVVYWSGGDGTPLGRAELDGSHVQTFGLVADAGSVAVDASHIYWTSGLRLRRADLDGSHSRALFDGFARNGIAVDANHVYWAADTSIGRADVDGSNPEPSFISGVHTACGVAVDDGHIYWGEADGNTVGRAALDGSNVEHSFISAAAGPCGVAVDAHHVYWTDWWDSQTTIGRADLDGANARDDFISGATSPCGIAVDASHIYWANEYGAGIGRANLDGTGVNQTFVATGGWPCGVAVDALIGTDTTASAPATVYGRPLTVTAQVTAHLVGAAPTGSVGFDVDGESAGSAVVGSTGQVAWSPAEALDVGAVVLARYEGDATYGPSHSAPIIPAITAARTAVEISVTPDQPEAGDDVILLARVVNLDSDVVPFGSVSFVINGIDLLGAMELDEDGYVGVEILDAPAGSYHLTAVYHDDTGVRADFADSRADTTRVLTVAPSAQPSPPPAQPSPPASSLTPVAVTPVTRADVRALLDRLSGKLRLRGLAGAERVPQRFRAAIPGRLTETIIAGKRHAGPPKRTVLARARRVFTSPGRLGLRLTLTRAGRRAARQHRARFVTISARFKPRTGAAVSTARTVKLTR